MMGTELLVAWGIANLSGFLFKKVLQLMLTSVEDYVKDFFKGYIQKFVNLPFELAKQEPLQKACVQGIVEFLNLVQLELEDLEIEPPQIEEYTEDLNKFIQDISIRETLGKPFEAALGLIAEDDSQLLNQLLAHRWNNLNLKTLPDNFNWERLAKRYRKKVQTIVNESKELRELLNAENLNKIRQELEQLTPVSPDFDLSRYQEGLKTAYSILRLDTLDTSGWENHLRLWEIFVPQDVGIYPGDSNQAQPICSVLDILNDEQKYKYTVIIGNPGSGKSTLMQSKALSWARTPIRDILSLELPLLIELRNFLDNRQFCHNFLEYYHKGSGINGGNLGQKELHDWLKNNKSIVMFDGLDEVLDLGERENVVTDIINFTHTYPKVRVLVTSRVIGYEQQYQKLRHANFSHFMLQDLNQEQIRNFVTQWHKLAFQDKNVGEYRRHRLQNSIDNSRAFRELAYNPLLLTMMAVLNRHEELPRDRSTLYENASKVLLQRWDGDKNLPEDRRLNAEVNNYIDYKAKQEMLRQIAYRMQCSTITLAGNLVISEQDLEDTLANYLQSIVSDKAKLVARVLREQLTTRSFILCFLGDNSYGFVHRTFLEYFCAWYFVEQYERKRNITLEYLKQEIFYPRWKDTSWHEVLSLIVGKIYVTSAGEIINYLMEQECETDDCLNLFLAAKCLLDVRDSFLIKETANKLLNKLKLLVEEQGSVSNTLRIEVIKVIKKTWYNDTETLRWLEKVSEA
ncbi:NACHT domain-containing protein [Iningainema tapete]|uniref:NACHT domain-containing protein n=1 Tax=Iningainema tapete BLCC-T55 TaxID=2748662 RepID=A0A8J6XK58_9CYAN|nr:NACHT domain-containing protein [Iningainema tapete]MBD2774402.1 NACHT domain-containing protein [Iningainema tapete BLCC-T55]